MKAVLHLASTGPGKLRVASGEEDFQATDTRRRKVTIQRSDRRCGIEFEVLEDGFETGARIRKRGYQEPYSTKYHTPEHVAADHLARFPEEEHELWLLNQPVQKMHMLKKIIATVFYHTGEAILFESHDISTAIMLWCEGLVFVRECSGSISAVEDTFTKALAQRIGGIGGRMWLPLPALPAWDVRGGPLLTPYSVARKIRETIFTVFGVNLAPQDIADFGIGFEDHHVQVKIKPLIACIRAMERREAKP